MTKSRGILGPRKVWTEAELQWLQREFPTTPTPELARQLGCEPYLISRLATKMKWRKTPEHRKRMVELVRSNLTVAGKAYRFCAGEPSWNKDKPYRPGGRTSETQFKPGRLAHETHNYVPLGTEKVRNGYLVRKVTDDPTVYPAGRWCFVHRLVWVAAHGPIPPGHLVVFKPGRFTTKRDLITLDALELRTRREHMNHNSVHTLMPPQLAELVRLRGVITRRIRELEENREEQNG
jgi:hypothetical protein